MEPGLLQAAVPDCPAGAPAGNLSSEPCSCARPGLAPEVSSSSVMLLRVARSVCSVAGKVGILSLSGQAGVLRRWKDARPQCMEGARLPAHCLVAEADIARNNTFAEPRVREAPQLRTGWGPGAWLWSWQQQTRTLGAGTPGASLPAGGAGQCRYDQTDARLSRWAIANQSSEGIAA